MIQGLSHVTFAPSDLDRMERMLVSVLGATKIYDNGERTFSIARERFFDLSGLWIAIIEGDPSPGRTYDHIALKFDARDLDLYRERIRTLGLEVRESRPRVDGEGASICFYDDDNHLFELRAGALPYRLRRYRRGDGGG